MAFMEEKSKMIFLYSFMMLKIIFSLVSLRMKRSARGMGRSQGMTVMGVRKVIVICKCECHLRFALALCAVMDTLPSMVKMNR